MTEQDLLAAIAAAKTPVSEGFTIAELALAAGCGTDKMRRDIGAALRAGTVRKSQKALVDTTGRTQIVPSYVTTGGTP